MWPEAILECAFFPLTMGAIISNTMTFLKTKKEPKSIVRTGCSEGTDIESDTGFSKEEIGIQIECSRIKLRMSSPILQGFKRRSVIDELGLKKYDGSSILDILERIVIQLSFQVKDTIGPGRERCTDDLQKQAVFLCFIQTTVLDMNPGSVSG
jgi:hypothetical protein